MWCPFEKRQCDFDCVFAKETETTQDCMILQALEKYLDPDEGEKEVE